MASIVKKYVDEHGPYYYKVIHLGNGKQKWEWIGKGLPDGVETGQIPDDTPVEEFSDTDTIVLTGETQDLSTTALRWGENRAVVREQVDEELLEKVEAGEELTEDEAARVEVALRAFAQHKNGLADDGTRTIMGDADTHDQWGTWATDAADDIDVAGETARDVLEARRMDEDRSEAKRLRADRVNEIEQRASDADVSLAPGEALGGVGSGSELEGVQNSTRRSRVDGQWVETGDKEGDTELDEIAGQDMEALQDEEDVIEALQIDRDISHDRAEEIVHRASDADVSLSPEEALDGVGTGSALEGGRQSERERPESNMDTELDEVAGQDMEALQDDDENDE